MSKDQVWKVLFCFHITGQKMYSRPKNDKVFLIIHFQSSIIYCSSLRLSCMGSVSLALFIRLFEL